MVNCHCLQCHHASTLPHCTALHRAGLGWLTITRMHGPSFSACTIKGHMCIAAVPPPGCIHAFFRAGFVPPANPHDEAVLFSDLEEALEWHYDTLGREQVRRTCHFQWKNIWQPAKGSPMQGACMHTIPPRCLHCHMLLSPAGSSMSGPGSLDAC